MFMNGELRQM